MSSKGFTLAMAAFAVAVMMSADAFASHLIFRVDGQVRCKNTGVPVEDVTVCATDELQMTMCTTTDANGDYFFEHPITGPLLDCIIWIPQQALVPDETLVCPVGSPPAFIPTEAIKLYNEYFVDPGTVQTIPSTTCYLNKDLTPRCDPEELGFCWAGIDFEIPCGSPPDCEVVCDLIAGQNTDVGDVTATISGDTLTIKYSVVSGYLITECNVAVGETLGDIPMTGSGNPKVGKFPYGDEHDPGVMMKTIDIDISGLTQPLVIATHAVVVGVNSGGQVVSEETAWCGDEDFPGRSWATYFEIDCE